jgi:hypothetical protein
MTAVWMQNAVSGPVETAVWMQTAGIGGLE